VQPKDSVVVDFVGQCGPSSKTTATTTTRDNNDDTIDGGTGIGDESGSGEDAIVFHKAKDWLIVVAEQDVVPCLELAIRFMSVGDTALVRSHSKFAYGPYTRRMRKIISNKFSEDDQNNGNDDDALEEYYMLPSNSNVVYRVTVKSIVSEEERGTSDFAVRAAEAKKLIGNDAYAHEWPVICDGGGDGGGGSSRSSAQLQHVKGKVIKLYKRGADAVEYLFAQLQQQQEEPQNQENQEGAASQEILSRAKALYLDCLNNIVAVHMRAKDYHAAKQAAINVLNADPSNYKALVRAAKACLLDAGSSYEEVQAAIDAAAVRAVVPGDDEDGTKAKDAEIKKLRSELRRRKLEYKKKSKDMFSKMAKEISTAQPASKLPPSSGKEEKKLEEVASSLASTKSNQSNDDNVGEIMKGGQQQPAFNWRSYLFQMGFQMVFLSMAFALTRFFKSPISPSAVDSARRADDASSAKQAEL